MSNGQHLNTIKQRIPTSKLAQKSKIRPLPWKSDVRNSKRYWSRKKINMLEKWKVFQIKSGKWPEMTKKYRFFF